MRYVGATVSLTMTGPAGMDVLVDVMRPDTSAFVTGQSVDEAPEGSYVYGFLPDAPGIWRVVFTGTGTANAAEATWVTVLATDAPAPFATPDYLAGTWRALTDAETGIAAGLLLTASRLIRRRVPGIDGAIASGIIDAQDAAMVCAEMVRRAMLNPGGIRSETIGPYQVAYNTAVASGYLTLTEGDLAALGVPLTASQIGTARIKPGLLGW